MSVYEGHGVTLHHADCLDVLRSLPDCSVDSVVCDPPYALGFMGREWDTFGMDVGRGAQARSQRRAEVTPTGEGHSTSAGPYLASGVDSLRAAGLPFQRWCEAWATECLRVLKPGGYLISAGGSRTYHRMTCGVEDAGFEIRDCITWHFGSGFPKSRNVSLDLSRLPSCACDVPGELGTVDTLSPAGAIGAGVGAEAGSVPLAGLPTDAARRVGPQVLAAPAFGGPNVDTIDEEVRRQGLPVVLGSAPVARPAQGQEVVGGIRVVEVDPEALRDEVVSEQSGNRATVCAGAVPSDDPSGHFRPASSLVLPLATAPGGVTRPAEAAPVVLGHAGSGAVGRGVGPTPELGAADDADVDAVSGARHGAHSTAERLARCEACGGLRGEIPQGLGTALKPATEFFVVARKPLVGTVAANVLTHGTGALNIGGCRVGDSGGGTSCSNRDASGKCLGHNNAGRSTSGETRHGPEGSAGRWPANVVLDESQAAALDEQSGEASYNPPGRFGTQRVDSREQGSTNIGPRGEGDGIFGYGDRGGASRFFYVAKAPANERPRVNGTAHPTVKPLDLMRWLVRLVTPPGGTVLEPFAGSGTTVEACIIEGFDCIAIEREADYLPLIRQRIDRRRDPVEALRGQAADLGLFDLLGGEGA